ncbi:unnamed protein product [Moneuplotes crassus]|uniref:Uncharacterized protein n=1 Tax=Euplotes crassus TaxID=5936 RepID=A0AAD1Y0N1_EUPCR|nr:unnamed protein product [Moneuplotes crassus]
MSDRDNMREGNSHKTPGEFKGSILIDSQRQKAFHPSCVVHINGKKYRLCKMDAKRAKRLISKQKIRERCNSLKKEAQFEFQQLQIEGSNQNIISMKVPVLGRDSDITKAVTQPAMFIPTECNEVSKNITKRSKRIQKILKGMRSNSPRHIPKHQQLSTNLDNRAYSNIRVKSPGVRRADYILSMLIESSAIPQITHKVVPKIKEPKAQEHLQNPRTFRRAFKIEENSTESEPFSFTTTRKLRPISGLPSTFSKKFQNIRGAPRPKINILKTEFLSPRVGKKSLRTKHDLSSILSNSEISMMRDKIMNDLASLI